VIDSLLVPPGPRPNGGGAAGQTEAQQAPPLRYRERSDILVGRIMIVTSMLV